MAGLPRPSTFARQCRDSDVCHARIRAHCDLLLPARHQGVYGIAREDGRKRPDALRRAMEKVGMRGASASLSLWKRPLTGPSSGFLSPGLALSPQSPDQVRGGRGKPRRSAIAAAVRDGALQSVYFPALSRMATP